MFPWIRKGIRTGVLTTRYPAISESMPEEFRGRPVLTTAQCQADQGCQECVQICLPGALSLMDISADGKGEEVSPATLTLDYGRCIQCGLCIEACPTDALHMTNEFELATRSAEDLRVVIRFAHTGPHEDERKEQENG